MCPGSILQGARGIQLLDPFHLRTRPASHLTHELSHAYHMVDRIGGAVDMDITFKDNPVGELQKPINRELKDKFNELRCQNALTCILLDAHQEVLADGGDPPVPAALHDSTTAWVEEGKSLDNILRDKYIFTGGTGGPGVLGGEVVLWGLLQKGMVSVALNMAMGRQFHPDLPMYM